MSDLAPAPTAMNSPFRPPRSRYKNPTTAATKPSSEALTPALEPVMNAANRTNHHHGQYQTKFRTNHSGRSLMGIKSLLRSLLTRCRTCSQTNNSQIVEQAPK